MAPKNNPMQRRMSTLKEAPMTKVHAALKALDDPSLPISYEDRMSMVEPLLKVKHGHFPDEKKASQDSDEK